MRPLWASIVAVGFAVAGQTTAPADPSQILAERFQFTSGEVAQAAQGQPVAKLLSGNARDELAVVGALRIDGDMHRLVNWVRDIASFRKAAELGHATVITQPVTEAAFAGFVPDPRDLAALRACRVAACDIRLSEAAIQQFQQNVRWDDPEAGEQAARVLRQMLTDYAKAYVTGGDAALGTYHNQKEPRAAADDFRTLLAGATNLKILAPEFSDYLEKFPAATLKGVDQLLYWTAVNEGADPLFTLHHLVVYPKSASEILIADKTIYASRSFEAAALVLSVQASSDSRGFFAIGAARVKSSKLSGLAARVLRSRIEKETLEGVKVYLGWIRDSLALTHQAAGAARLAASDRTEY
jgi:hypothetical protein